MANNDDRILLYVGAYNSMNDAQDDYGIVKQLSENHLIGTYDAGVVEKDENGKLKIHQHTSKTKHGAWTGAGVGALVGLFFPPALIASAATGAAIGGVASHHYNKIPKEDLKAIGNFLDNSAAALVVLAEPASEKELEKAVKKATKKYQKQFDVNVKELERELKEAEKDNS